MVGEDLLEEDRSLIKVNLEESQHLGGEEHT